MSLACPLLIGEPMFRTKRVYDIPSTDDGYRVLVDRLWPRGLSRAKARISLWLKEIAPSDTLRKWFGHQPEKWGEFKRKYRAELAPKTELVGQMKRLERDNGVVTLLFAAKDTEHNNAKVLLELLSR
jgi:uncharacterized protein YeaO (DUF488 family)